MAPVTRWLVVGPYPPERGTGAEAARAFVEQRLQAAEAVHVVSPRPSAAHEHAALESFGGLRTLWELARTHHADGIWLRIEPGVVLRPGIDRRRGLVERLALTLLLRRFRERILDVGDVGLLPGGRSGRPLLAAATRFVTHRDADADALVLHGADPDRVQRVGKAVAAPAPDVPTPEPVEPTSYPPPHVLADLLADRSAIESAVRTRADELRAVRAQAARAPRVP